MPLFAYKAARPDGEVIEGQLEAADTRAAAQHLKAEGQIPIRISEFQRSEARAARTPLLQLQRGGLNARDIEMFTLQLSTLLHAGLPLGQALETLHKLVDKPALKEVVSEVNQSIRRGDTLSQALREAHPLFDRFYLNMVRAGESSGALDLALESLARFKSNSREMRESLISALIYPAILLVLALVAVAVMLGFVVPQFTEMFDQAGRDMPLLTRIVAGSGEIITRWWWLMLLGIVGGIYLLRRSWAQAEGRERRDLRLLRLPLAGQLILKLETARFTRTLATLLRNGVALLTAMDIAKEIVGNRIVAQALGRVAGRVRQGEGLSGPLTDTRVFPSLATQLIKVGEQTGELEGMLGQVATIYEKEVDSGLKRLLGLVEPLIIIFIALFVTLIILSVVLMILASQDIAF